MPKKRVLREMPIHVEEPDVGTPMLPMLDHGPVSKGLLYQTENQMLQLGKGPSEGREWGGIGSMEEWII